MLVASANHPVILLTAFLLQLVQDCLCLLSFCLPHLSLCHDAHSICTATDFVSSILEVRAACMPYHLTLPCTLSCSVHLCQVRIVCSVTTRTLAQQNLVPACLA